MGNKEEKKLDGLLNVFRYVKPYRQNFIGTIFLSVLLAIVSPLRPWLTQLTIDNYIAKGDEHHLLLFTALMLITALLNSFLQIFYASNTNLLGQNIIADLRKNLFSKLQSFNLTFFDTTPIGITITRLVSDMETIADIFTDGLLVIISDLLQLVAIIAFMFYIDWRLALISLSTVPVLIIATRVFQKNIKKSFNDVRSAVSNLNTFVQEHLTGMRIVQVFNREDEEYKKFQSINREHRTANIKSVWYYSIFFPVVELLSASAIGLIVWYGTRAILHHELQFGVVVAFIMYINLLFRPIRELADKFNTLQMGMVSSERIFKLLNLTKPIVKNGTLSADKLKGNIEFKNVWFKYNADDENSKWVLRNISFKVGVGEVVAFVGPTGAGKTSIIGLINRFYEIQKGEILIDGINIQEFDIHQLRTKIGLVQQDVFLFSDTIKNNITLYNEDISHNDVKLAATEVGANRFIERLPGTYDFNVQERGTQLSVGQRQLLAFVRAGVYKPLIFILDEATSSLDSESEDLISKATENVSSKCTSIIIAHRLSTIRRADNIIVIDKGEIIQQGKHEQLVAKEGMYKRLYEIQLLNRNN